MAADDFFFKIIGQRFFEQVGVVWTSWLQDMKNIRKIEDTEAYLVFLYANRAM